MKPKKRGRSSLRIRLTNKGRNTKKIKRSHSVCPKICIWSCNIFWDIFSSKHKQYHIYLEHKNGKLIKEMITFLETKSQVKYGIILSLNFRTENGEEIPHWQILKRWSVNREIT